MFTVFYSIQWTRWGSVYTVNKSIYLNWVPKWNNGEEALLTTPQLPGTTSTRGHNWLCFLVGRIGTFGTGLSWVSASLCVMEEGNLPSLFEKMLWKHVHICELPS